MSPSVYRAGELRAAPWKNGGGTTREVACALPTAGTADFDWRISIADVAASGSFSTFPGVDRVIVLVGGGRMVLGVDAQHHELTAFEPFAFSGDADTTCEVFDGPTRDLNVMTRRDSVRADVEVRDVAGPETIDVSNADELFVVVLSGGVAIDAGSDPTDLPVELGLLDTARWVSPTLVELHGEAKVAVIALDLPSCALPRG